MVVGSGEVSSGLTGAVVVNYNSASHLSRCLASLVTEGVGAIVVVDNCSTIRDEWDQVQRIAAQFERVEAYRSSSNRGFGAGVNLAVSRLPTHIVSLLIVNPDAYLVSGCLRDLERCLSDWGGEAIIAPTILTEDGSVWSRGGEVDIARGCIQPSRASSRGQRQVSFVSGAVLLMERNWFDRLGGFREDLFMYWEDTDLCLRAQAKKLSLLVIDNAVAVHAVGQSSNQGADRKSVLWHYYMQRNRLVVCSDWGAYPGGLVLGRGRRVMLRLVWTACMDRKRGRKCLAAVIGILDGLSAVRKARLPADRRLRPRPSWL